MKRLEARSTLTIFMQGAFQQGGIKQPLQRLEILLLTWIRPTRPSLEVVGHGTMQQTNGVGIEVELKKPELSVEEYEAQNNGPVYKERPDQCCFDRKIRLLRPALDGKHAWASAIRRDQSPDRAQAPIVAWDEKFQLVKVSPLANWTKGQVWKFITDNDIPYNPLHDQGYPSIGCQPCTRAILLGEDERAGRWSGFAKTECGLHSRN